MGEAAGLARLWLGFMRSTYSRYLDLRDILTQVYMREKNFRSIFMMTKTVRAA